MGFSNFNPDSFLLKFIFLFHKKHGLFDFKTPFLSKLKQQKKTHSFALRLLIFYLQKKFENLVISV